MKWHERNTSTIDLAILVFIAISVLGILGMIFFLPVKSHGSSCLTIDVPPQAVVRVIDGDTFHVFNLLPPGYVPIRLKGVDTPEFSRKKGVPDEPGAADARQFTARWLAAGPVRLHTCGKQTFERVEGIVERNGLSLAAELKAAGYGK